MKKSKQIAICGILTALSIVLIFLGSIITVLCYAMPIFVGLILIIALKNVNQKSAFTIYICVSIISIIFMPDKECALTYTFFFGYYPIIKPHIDKLKVKIFRVIIKLSIFNSGIILSQALLIYAFGIPIENTFGKYTILILLILGNFILFAYEKCVNAVTIIYIKKYYSKVKKMLNN